MSVSWIKKILPRNRETLEIKKSNNPWNTPFYGDASLREWAKCKNWWEKKNPYYPFCYKPTRETSVAELFRQTHNRCFQNSDRER